MVCLLGMVGLFGIICVDFRDFNICITRAISHYITNNLTTK